MGSLFGLSLFGLVLVMFLAPSFAASDAQKGRKLFKKCIACHTVGGKAKNKVGPILNNIIGRQAGTVERYKYSKINKAAGEAGLKWTEEAITAYLPDPNKFLRAYLKQAGKQALGRTKMTYRLKKKDEIAHIIAFLKTHSKPIEEGKSQDNTPTAPNKQKTQ
ncbi:MAG: c-type cytochrome [Pseudomonadota bacterium]